MSDELTDDQALIEKNVAEMLESMPRDAAIRRYMDRCENEARMRRIDAAARHALSGLLAMVTYSSCVNGRFTAEVQGWYAAIAYDMGESMERERSKRLAAAEDKDDDAA